MNAYLFRIEKFNRRWFGLVFEFLLERLVLGSVAVLIVYGGYRMFML
jgi:hypothetical protein